MNKRQNGFRTVMIRRAFDWTGQTGYEGWSDDNAPIFSPSIGLLKRDLEQDSSLGENEPVLWQIEPPMDTEEMLAINEKVKLFKFE